MKKSSANLIALGQRELRAMGEKCDPACFVWYGCGNSKPDGVCAGFLLLDGETKRHLNKLLSADDEKYVSNCMRMLQNGSKDEGLVKEVLRYIEPQPKERPSGVSYMAKCALGSPDEPIQEPTEPQPPSTEFRRMLTASTKGTKGEGTPTRTSVASIIQRANDFDFEHQLPQICSESCIIKRHCGAYPAQVGNLCIKLSEQYRNDKFVGK